MKMDRAGVKPTIIIMIIIISSSSKNEKIRVTLYENPARGLYIVNKMIASPTP